MGLDLRDLALKYNDYLQHDVEVDGPLEEGEEDEFTELKELDKQLDGMLYYPNHVSDIQIVEDTDVLLREWGISQCEERWEIDSSHPLAEYIDYLRYAQDWISSEWESIQYEGNDYYILRG
jgi:hypothetical protein